MKQAGNNTCWGHCGEIGILLVGMRSGKTTLRNGLPVRQTAQCGDTR